MYPLLRGEIIGQGPYKVVQVGDKQVDCNPKFKLFMVTRNPNPDISIDGKSLVSMINFTTTKAGLTGQLLGKALHLEKPKAEFLKSPLFRPDQF